nr:recombinase family protein [Sinomonas atrocyanea]
MFVVYATMFCFPLLLIRFAHAGGHGRVSTRDQHVDAQQDALAAAGCEQVFVDSASGKLASRPGLEKALLSANRAGDQLVVPSWTGSVGR